MSCSRLLSRAFSLIDQLLIAFSTINGIGAQGAVFYQIDLTPQQFFQVHIHTAEGEERKGPPSTVWHYQYVDIGVLALLASGVGAEEPSLQDGLRLEVLGYCLLDCLGGHQHTVFVIYGANIQQLFHFTKFLEDKNGMRA